MRSREMQRVVRRAKGRKEDPLGRRDYCGIRDPTPYEAVKNIIRQEKERLQNRSHH
mgnify:CR=1 FL=1